jgi:hypothetical protein
MPKMDFLPQQLDLAGIVSYDAEVNDIDFFNPSREGIIKSKPVAPEPGQKP